MKTSELQDILDQWNSDAFDSLGKFQAHEPFPPGCGGKIYPATVFQRPCYLGKVANNNLFPDVLLHPTSKDALAVGAVLDDTSSPQKDFARIVVAVGINYTQFFGPSSDAMLHSLDWRSTKMRPRLQKTFVYLDSQGDWENMEVEEIMIIKHGLYDVTQGDFHLVAVNFFPWITKVSWSQMGLNAIAEALVLHCCGYDHPAGLVANLVERIGIGKKASVDFVVFHGAACAVPHHGIETVRLLKANRKTTSNYIFCDNLSPRIPLTRLNNAALLLP